VAVFSRLVALTRSVSFSLVVVGFVSPALAAPFGPEEATELLARTLSADVKCKVLNKAENDQLQSFVAQAEVALAEQSGVPKTKATLDRGKAAGAKVACDATTAKAVRGVLFTARDALASSSDLRKDEDVAQNENEEEAVTAEPLVKKPIEQKPVARLAKADPEKAKPELAPVTAKAAAKPATKPAVAMVKKPQPNKPADTKIAVKPVGKKIPVKKIEGDATVETASVKKPVADKTAAKKPATGPALVAYAKLAEAYFVELKCRKMAPREIQAFYGKVMQNHRTAVAAHGGSIVSSTVRGAQARANGKSCS
jgi:hypothetical protein